jgi:hypothetical protein
MVRHSNMQVRLAGAALVALAAYVFIDLVANTHGNLRYPLGIEGLLLSFLIFASASLGSAMLWIGAPLFTADRRLARWTLIVSGFA